MNFLVDANLPRSAALLLQQLGHSVRDVRDIGLGSAPDDTIAALAQRDRLVLITRDFDFADIRNYPPSHYAGIIVLQLPDDAMADQVVKLLESFIRQQQLLLEIAGKLAVVEVWRVRFRTD